MLLSKYIVHILPIMVMLSISCENQPYRNSIFNKSCNCDSIPVMSLDFMMDDDSAIYSIPQKVAFNFSFIIDSSAILINNKNYHFLIAGIQNDTVGLICINENNYTYRADKKAKDDILFDFNKKINESWLITGDGYFKNYNIKLSKILFDNTLNDSVYFYQSDFKRLFPFGYSFTNFRVSKKLGIIGYCLEVDGDLGIDTLNCICR